MSACDPTSRRLRAALFLAVLLLVPALPAVAVGPQLPDFTYQGRLTQNGAPANGNFNFDFVLFNDPVGGSQVSGVLSEPGFPVVDGLFTVSLAFPGAFNGTQLWLQVSVNGVPLLPRQAVSSTPVAQYALSGAISGPAGGDLTGSYPAPTIAAGAVTNAKLATGAVSSSKIGPGAVTGSAIATGAVASDEILDGSIVAADIANGAIGTAAIATDAVTRSKLAGAFSNGLITINLAAGQCLDFQLGINGAQPGDMAIFNMQASATLPQGVLIMPIKVSQADAVLTRFCNVSNSAVSFSSQGVLIQTLR